MFTFITKPFGKGIDHLKHSSFLDSYNHIGRPTQISDKESDTQLETIVKGTGKLGASDLDKQTKDIPVLGTTVSTLLDSARNINKTFVKVQTTLEKQDASSRTIQGSSIRDYIDIAETGVDGIRAAKSLTPGGAVQTAVIQGIEQDKANVEKKVEKVQKGIAVVQTAAGI